MRIPRSTRTVNLFPYKTSFRSVSPDTLRKIFGCGPSRLNRRPADDHAPSTRSGNARPTLWLPCRRASVSHVPYEKQSLGNRWFPLLLLTEQHLWSETVFRLMSETSRPLDRKSTRLNSSH